VANRRLPARAPSTATHPPYVPFHSGTPRAKKFDVATPFTARALSLLRRKVHTSSEMGRQRDQSDPVSACGSLSYSPAVWLPDCHVSGMACRLLCRLLPLALLLLLGAQAASADTLTFTFQGLGTGSIGTTSFTNSAFTITLTTDTTAISEFTLACSPTPCTIFDVPATTATISADGMTTAITSPIGVFDNQTLDVLGLSRITGGGPSGISLDLMDLSNPAFGTYDLSVPLATVGPFNLSTMGEFSCSSGCVLSTVGDMSMTSASDVYVTAVAVPEPASVLLLGSGLLLIAGIRRKARS
jgi:PEP-CTERM motif-containing protein